MVLPDILDTWVEVDPDFTGMPRRIEVELRYYDDAESEEPVHVDTLVYALDDLIGPTPSTSLRDPDRLRRQLADRSQKIGEEIARLRRLEYLLSGIPPGYRFTREEARQMLEGMLDG